jgi:hypothetical protein
MLTTFYGAIGNPPEARGALVLMAKALAARVEPAAVNLALDRCMIECRFPVRLPDIFQRMPGTEVAEIDAEKRLAWDIVIRTVSKWGRWNSERTHAFLDDRAPTLAPRILDSVRRTGGWTVYHAMEADDFPHVQKRFFEEYSAWIQVERITDRARLLEMPRVKELAAAKSMEGKSAVTQKRADRPAPEKPRSPQMARIMKQIDKLRRRM